MSGSLTRVALVHVQQRINVYLRFGLAAHAAIIDRYRRIAYFRPGTVFCRVRWEANEYGTALWQLLVLQASAPRKSSQRIAGVAPGATILLHVDGARKIKPVLFLIDAIEAQRIDPADVSPSYWRTTHNRLAACLEASPYTPERQAARLLVGWVL